jgi:RNA polymerase sigma-70 factor, ECF subfamily
MREPSRKMTNPSTIAGPLDARTAFVEAVERSRALLIRRAWRITQNMDEAEDVVQEAVTKAFISLHQFRGEARIETWLRSIVENTAYNWARRRRVRVLLQPEQTGHDDADFILHEIPDTRRNPEQWCEFKELEDRVMAAIDNLSPRHKAVIQMCVLGGCSYVEASLALNLSLVTVKARIFHGRGIVQRKLRESIPDRKRRESSLAARGRMA